MTFAELGRAVAADAAAAGDDAVVQRLQRLEGVHLPGEVVHADARLVRPLRLRVHREQRQLVRGVLAPAEERHLDALALDVEPDNALVELDGAVEVANADRDVGKAAGTSEIGGVWLVMSGTSRGAL